jgi:hypothetical protein
VLSACARLTIVVSGSSKMSIAVTLFSCAWDAPRSDAKLMLNAPRIFAYLRMPTPLAWPTTVLAYREVRQRASLALGPAKIRGPLVGSLGGVLLSHVLPKTALLGSELLQVVADYFFRLKLARRRKRS